MRKRRLLLVVMVAALVSLIWLPEAKATPGAAAGAVLSAAVAAILCDEIVRSNMRDTPASDESWYLFWHHVHPEDVAGFAAGTACAIVAAPVGAVAGLGVQGAMVGMTAATTSKGGYRLLTPHLKRAWRHIPNAWQTIRQWPGKFKVGPAAPSTPLRTRHMAALYERQKGWDTVCNVPLPDLYVGPFWNRKLNPEIEVDHIMPRAKGGDDSPLNLQLTHRKYNRAKGTLTGKELWLAMARVCPGRY